jgi:hypothetical protein
VVASLVLTITCVVLIHRMIEKPESAWWQEFFKDVLLAVEAMLRRNASSLESTLNKQFDLRRSPVALLTGERLLHASATARSTMRRLAIAATIALFVAAWLPAIYVSRLQLHRMHPVHAPQRLATGRAAMLRHATHYRAFESNSTVLKVGMVADMDRVSKIHVAKNSAWMSIFKTLLLVRDPADDSYSVQWLEEVPLVSRLSEADRGMELSELLYFHDKLLSFSDRTGVIYQIADSKLVPLWILSDFDGNSEDGFKSEWATVKDGENEGAVRVSLLSHSYRRCVARWIDGQAVAERRRRESGEH